MRNALAAFARATRASDGKGRLEATAEFYAVILERCGNRIIEETLQGLLARINFLRARSMSRPGRAKLSLQEMRKILAAIEQGDPAAAREAAADHTRQAHRAARAIYEKLD
jgi:DNA-binding FadR family transcriptional regulator